MSALVLRFARRAPGTVFDQATHLEWDLEPPGGPAAWHDALRTAGASWRLPSLDEVMTFVSGLPDDLRSDALGAGVTVWTATESPFAPVTVARAVACAARGGLAVVLLEKDAPATWWRVRSAAG